MKPKAMISLVVVFALLAGLIMFKRSQETQESLIQQAELTPLVSEGIDFSAVNRLEIYAGVKPAERVALLHDGDRWRIGTMHNALAIKGRPKQMLDAIEGLQGEFRATVSGEELADYDLTDERAFHVIGFTGEREELFHVLTGKSPKYGDMFMRTSGSNSVYLVNKNIRRDAFLYSLDYDDPPKSDPWFDKQIVGIQGDDFTKAELTMSDKILVAEKRDVEPAEPTGDDGAAVISEPTKEWVVTEGGFNGEVHQTPFRDLERYIANLTAFTAIAPEKEAIWGLDKPNYHVRMHRENGEIIDLEISHPSTNGPGYLRRLDNNEKTLYGLELSKFIAIFASGGAYYDLPGLLLEEGELNGIEYSLAGNGVKIVREAGGWQVSEPDCDLPTNQTALAQMERVLASWQAADYADASTDGGFGDSTDSVSFSTSDTTHHISLGGKSTHIGGRYARLGDSDDTLVMSRNDFNAIFLSHAQLFELALVPIDEKDEIVHFEMTRDDSRTVFQLGDLAWEATKDGESFKPTESKIDSYLTGLAEAEADDVAVDASSTSGDRVASLLVKTDNGTERTLSAVSNGEDTYSVSVNGSQSTYTIDQAMFDTVFPAPDTFVPSDEEEVIEFKPPALSPEPGHAPSDGHNH